jgi:hypothetical protein
LIDAYFDQVFALITDIAEETSVKSRKAARLHVPRVTPNYIKQCITDNAKLAVSDFIVTQYGDILLVAYLFFDVYLNPTSSLHALIRLSASLVQCNDLLLLLLLLL